MPVVLFRHRKMSESVGLYFGSKKRSRSAKKLTTNLGEQKNVLDEIQQTSAH